MKNSNKLSASELVSIVTEVTARTIAETLPRALTDTFVSLGLVAVQTNPHSVPNVGRARVSNAPSLPRVTVPSIPVPQATAKPKAQSLPKVPLDGEMYATVGEKADGTGRVDRVKLPMGLFAGHKFVDLYFPDGESVRVNADNEGRGRLSKGLLDRMRIESDSTLVFTEQNVNQHINAYWVSIRKGRARAESSAKGHTEDLEAMFCAPKAPTAPKPRSAAQLANDAKLREMALARNAERNAPQAQGKVRPQMVQAPVITRKQQRTEAQRNARHPQAYASQQAHRHSVVQAVAVPRIIKKGNR